MSDKVSSSSSSGGIGFVGLLTIVFIVLKLIGKITWSWWWALSPIWISTLLVVAILLLVLGGVGVTAGVALLIEQRDSRKRLQRSKERIEQRAAERAKSIR